MLAAWWLLIAAGALWRRTVWREAGAHVREVARRWGRPPVATWTGYRVDGDGVRVVWRGGLRGEVTLVRGAAGREARPGLADADTVEAISRRCTSAG